jgi:TonB family protein
MTNPSLSPASRMPDAASVPLQPKHELPGLGANRESSQVLAELRATITVGGVNLDAMLQRIVDAAQVFTDANGAAIALQHDNWVVCRARAGEMAPDLNSILDSGSGISGECLRSGKALCCHDTSADSRVDAAACQRLGLRSLAVAPIGERPSVQGLLEAFSARPYAFGDTELSLLKKLAELVTATQQGSTKPVAPRTRMHEKLASKALSFSKRKLVAAALVTLAFVVGLSLRKRPQYSNVAAAAGAPPLKWEPSPAAVDFSRLEEKPSPVRHSNSETSPPAGVTMASKIAKFGSGEGVITRPSPEAASKADRPLLHVPAPHSQPPQSADESVSVPPPVSEVSGRSDKAIAGLLSSSAVFPQPVMVSQGVSGGTLDYKVNPTYPSEARVLRREGRVTLDGVIAEDGRLRELKVVGGDPMLAGAAMQAVSKWRYHPYKLNGAPIRMSTTITLIFKLP